MAVFSRNLEKAIIALYSFGFLIWGVAFISNSSFIAVDGRRYFCLTDDAMISMRYAWNFSHGLGLVWNQGEYIQGYTNLLMTLLMSLVTLFFDKSTAVLFIQILGIGFMLAIAFVSMKISGHILQFGDYQRQAFGRVLSFICALSYYPLLYWSLMGMETGLLTLLTLLGILSALNFVKNPHPSRLFLAAGYLGLAFLTRNDSIVSAFLIFAYLAWELLATGLPTNRKGITLLFQAIALYFLFVIGQLAFQYFYYGEFLPNTYTLKLTGMPLLLRLSNGVGFITPFLVSSAFMLVLAGSELVLDFRRQKLLLYSVVLSTIAYQVYTGGDPWAYWRIMSPSMPLLMTLSISAAYTLLISISSTPVFIKLAGVYFSRVPKFLQNLLPQFLLVMILFVGMRNLNLSFIPQINFQAKPYQVESNKNNVNTAIVLNQLTRPDATVGVIWAGSIPYFADRKAVDFLGKSDRYIAQLPPDLSGNISWSGMTSVPGHNKYDLNYSIKTIQPTYVQIFKWGAQDLSQWAATNYVRIKYNGVTIFLLKDSPAVLWSKINIP